MKKILHWGQIMITYTWPQWKKNNWFTKCLVGLEKTSSAKFEMAFELLASYWQEVRNKGKFITLSSEKFGIVGEERKVTIALTLSWPRNVVLKPGIKWEDICKLPSSNKYLCTCRYCGKIMSLIVDFPVWVHSSEIIQLIVGYADLKLTGID